MGFFEKVGDKVGKGMGDLAGGIDKGVKRSSIRTREQEGLCKKCDTKNDHDAKFCKKCGNSL
jgi:hypothetical protein